LQGLQPHFREEDTTKDVSDSNLIGLKSWHIFSRRAFVHTHLSACPAPRPRGTKLSAASPPAELAMSSEVPNSSWCEIEGLKRSIDLLRQHDLHLSTLITDRHRQCKWVREELCPERDTALF
ncbi:unnamed protein product, partial [Boreogadus saida]